jgi:hypothetical protein
MNLFGQKGAGIYAELFGNGLFYSINYETRFSDAPNGFGAKAGLGVLPSDGSVVITVPIMANYLIGKEHHFLEIGAGMIYAHGLLNLINDLSRDNGVVATFSVAYKWRTSKGLYGKIGYAPSFGGGLSVPIWPSLGIGYEFQ